MINITFLNTLLLNPNMQYFPIELYEAEHCKTTIAEIDEIIQSRENEKGFFDWAKKTAQFHMVAGGIIMAIAPLKFALYAYSSNLNLREIATSAAVGLTGLAVFYFGKKIRKWVIDEEKLHQERKNELLEERVEFLRMKKENEESPAYRALMN